MEQVLDFAKRLLLPHCHFHGVYLDGTMGNGQDTLFFAENCPESLLYAFDIQEEALFQTRTLLAKHHLAACLIRDSHEHLDHYVKKPLDAAIFNFGYLPNGDKTITTTADSSLSAVQKALSLLKDTGILVLVCYPGHPAGAEEAKALENWARALDASAYNVIKYDFINKHQPPFVIAIEHRTAKKSDNTDKTVTDSKTES